MLLYTHGFYLLYYNQLEFLNQIWLLEASLIWILYLFDIISLVLSLVLLSMTIRYPQKILCCMFLPDFFVCMCACAWVCKHRKQFIWILELLEKFGSHYFDHYASCSFKNRILAFKSNIFRVEPYLEEGIYKFSKSRVY